MRKRHLDSRMMRWPKKDFFEPGTRTTTSHVPRPSSAAATWHWSSRYRYWIGHWLVSTTAAHRFAPAAIETAFRSIEPNAAMRVGAWEK